MGLGFRVVGVGVRVKDEGAKVEKLLLAGYPHGHVALLCGWGRVKSVEQLSAERLVFRALGCGLRVKSLGRRV